jgi:hypothetical protein
VRHGGQPAELQLDCILLALQRSESRHQSVSVGVVSGGCGRRLVGEDACEVAQPSIAGRRARWRWHLLWRMSRNEVEGWVSLTETLVLLAPLLQPAR